MTSQVTKMEWKQKYENIIEDIWNNEDHDYIARFPHKAVELMRMAVVRVLRVERKEQQAKLTLSESRVRGEALTDMFLEIAKLAEPDERQSSSGDLHTNMDDIWEIKKRLASITKKEGE